MMPDFDVTSPSGKKYRVTAPDGAVEKDIIAKAQEFESSSQNTQTAGKLDQRSVWQKLTGQGGERYQLFPERMARDVYGDIKGLMDKAQSTPIGHAEEMAPESLKVAADISPLGPETRIAKGALSVVPEARKTAVDLLKKEGIDVTAGQARGSTPLRTAESQLGTAPFSGDVATEKYTQQLGQFTKAALKKVGEDSDRASPEVIDRAFTRIGKEFDRLEQNTLIPDKQLASEIGTARDNYLQVTSPYSRLEAIPNIGNEISAYTHKGIPMSGKAYKAARSQLDRIRRTSVDPVVKEAVGDYIGALDGAMERTLERTNSSDLGAWREARRQYRNMLVIEKALPAGEQGAEGLITPAKLRQAALGQHKRQFRRGKSEFSDLATAGEQILTPVKSSKTAERAMIGAIPAELGFAAGTALHGNLPLAGSMAATTVLPGMAGRALMSKPMQEYLKKPMQRYGGKVIPQELLNRGGIQELISALGGRGGANNAQ